MERLWSRSHFVLLDPIVFGRERLCHAIEGALASGFYLKEFLPYPMQRTKTDGCRLALTSGNLWLNFFGC